MHKEDLIRNLRRQKFPEKIVKAFEKVNRKDFVPKEQQISAYEDKPLPIGEGQTISQPYTIAFMLMLLELDSDKKQKILEVGSGSGYVLALINEISKNSELYGVEVIKELSEKSKQALKDKKNIQIFHKSGKEGLPEKAPFDKILVSAAAKQIPQKLTQQLKLGGILVVPVRNSIMCIKKFANENQITEFPGFAFVPLVD